MRLPVVLLFSLFACGEPSVVPQPTTPSQPTPSPTTAAAPMAPTPPEDVPQSTRLGKVLELLDGGANYTYARMDACGSEAWVAGPKASWSVGQVIEMQQGMPMTDFKSKTLDRTFEQLLLVNGWKTATNQVLDCTPTQKRDGPAPTDMRFGLASSVEHGAGYTFVELDHCGTKTWVAGPDTPVKKGDLVATAMGSSMSNFYAKSIDHKFPVIHFVQKIQRTKALPTCD